MNLVVVCKTSCAERDWRWGKIGEFLKNDYNSLEMTEAQNWGIKTEREELIELDWQGWGGDGGTREHS